MYRYMHYHDYGYGGSMRYTQREMKSIGFFKTFPDFLQKRSSGFIKHCRWRTRYRHEIGTIRRLQDGSFKVQSMSDRTEYYQVTLGEDVIPQDPSCNCPDWQRKGWPCKHILAILMHYDGDNDDDDESGSDNDDDDSGSDTSADDNDDDDDDVIIISDDDKGVKVEAVEVPLKLEPGLQKIKTENMAYDGKAKGVKIEAVEVPLKLEPGLQKIKTENMAYDGKAKGVKVEAVEAPLKYEPGLQKIKIENMAYDGKAKGVKVEAVEAPLKYEPGLQKIKTENRAYDGNAKGVKLEPGETLLKYEPGRQKIEADDGKAKDGAPPEKKRKPHEVRTPTRRSTRIILANRAIKKEGVPL